jgi:preprotein translocase subunit YajC
MYIEGSQSSKLSLTSIAVLVIFAIGVYFLIKSVTDRSEKEENSSIEEDLEIDYQR